MYPFDRFEIGLPDRQADYPTQVADCAYVRCANPIYAGEPNWYYYGEWFCSSLCIAKYLGADKRCAN
ncbi:hypothetical protein AV654_16530 [Paenibacillus elgii]|uniref:TRASH domain-containing protein n=1 Tax=Paenibacillus elgii TaxID=189691 RepID=A0A161S3M4_9BACL|nr:hypothetical protein [Paenibacillus elgii]KZE79089.1 hypothetical protein AV654_16530 [Paenibacillus elgii]